MGIEENVPLAPRTTFKVGGSARFLVEGKSVADIREAAALAEKKGLPFIVLGGGSNLLVDDGVCEAVFYAPKNKGLSIQEMGNTAVVLIAAAAETWDETVAFAVHEGLYGLENLSGIPGQVGGAAVQNIGAYGAALSDTAVWVEAYDLQEKVLRTLSAEECRYGYRRSLFKDEPNRFVIVRVAFQLSRTGSLDTSYRDLQEFFAHTAPTLAAVREAVLSIRAKKFPDLEVEGTAGSFFKNPIVSEKEAAALTARFPDMPLYSVPEALGVKVPLAWFLDRVLALRGYTRGRVRCFEAQPLVLVAAFGATAQEVRAQARFVQQEVAEKIGLNIEPEVCILRNNILTTDLTF